MSTQGSSANQELTCRIWFLGRVCSLAVIGTGAAALIGHAFHIQVLASLLPQFVAMAPNTALAFVLAGTGLWLAQGGNRPGLDLTLSHRRRNASLAALLAAAVIVISALTLLEYVAGFDAAGLDRWLFPEASGADLLHPGRMAPNSALALLAVGLALLWIVIAWVAAAGVSRARHHRAPVLLLMLMPAVISLAALVGYIYGDAGFYSGFTPYEMAMTTALTLLLLSAGLAAAQPTAWPVSLLSSDDAGGMLARRLFIGTLLVPLGIAFLAAAGRQAGLYSSLTETALETVLVIVVLTAMAIATSQALHESDLERRAALEQLRAEKERAQEMYGMARQAEAETRRVNGELETANTALSETAAYLRQARSELEQRVQERTASLSDALAKLTEANQALHMLSHQLIEVQENEHRALARELHDEAGQSLTALTCGARAAGPRRKPAGRHAPTRIGIEGFRRKRDGRAASSGRQPAAGQPRPPGSCARRRAADQHC